MSDVQQPETPSTFSNRKIGLMANKNRLKEPKPKCARRPKSSPQTSAPRLKNSSLCSLTDVQFHNKCSREKSPPHNGQDILSNGSQGIENTPKWQCPVRKRATSVTPLRGTWSMSQGCHSIPTLGITSWSILPRSETAQLRCSSSLKALSTPS